MKVAYGICAVLLAIIAFILETDIIIQNPWQILNPFMQFTLAIRFFMAPAVWLLLPLTLIFGLLAAKR